jgi:hypothetical protein
VWLTTAETTATTEEAVEHYRSRCLSTEEEIEESQRHRWVLDTGRTHRFTVRVRSGPKLQNYGDWLRANGDVVIVNENGMAQANNAGELYAVRHMAAALSPRGLIDQVMSDSSDDSDGAGFGFVYAAVEHFSQVVMREDPDGPWATYAVLFLSDDEALQ